MQKDQDDVDLIVISRAIRNFFRSIGNGIAGVLHVIRKKILVMLLAISLGLGIGYLVYSNIQPYYTSSMTLVLAEIRNEFVEEQLNRLITMVEDRNFEAVASSLDISVEDALQIKSINFSNLDQTRVAEDSILTSSPFRITLSMFTSNLFPVMEPALASYLEDNRYFSRLKQIKQRQVESTINKLKENISSIDSIKTTVVNPRGPVNGFVFGEPLDPIELYRESLAMYEQQVELEAELERINNIQVVNGFSIRLRPSGPNLIKYLTFGAFVFFLFGLMIAYQLERRGKD